MFKGCGTALVTPFTRGGALDQATLRALVRRGTRPERTVLLARDAAGAGRLSQVDSGLVDAIGQPDDPDSGG